MLIGDWWPIPIHRNCNCQQVPIMPGAEARPFANFQEIWDDLSPSQQLSAVGKSSYQLIQEGVVDFKAVVSPTHVLTLQEVVAENHLTVNEMVKAGVRPDIAQKAFDAANTPAAVLNQQRQQALIKQIQGAGVSPQQIRQMVGKAITQRVVIGSGPSGVQVMPSPVTGLPPELILLLNRYDIPPSWRPKAEPEPETDEED
jgi:hypothetical protein